MESLPVTLLQVLSQTLQIYSLVLIVRVLLSWFPNLDCGNPAVSYTHLTLPTTRSV